MCLKHANRQHTTRDKRQKQIIVTAQWYMWLPAPPPTGELLLPRPGTPETLQSGDTNAAWQLWAQETPDWFSNYTKQHHFQVH